MMHKNDTAETKFSYSSVREEISHQGIVLNRLVHMFEDYKLARTGREDTWLESWAVYLGTPATTQYLRSNVGKIVGDVNDDWRHHIQVSKAYEIVETIVSYLMGAFFPNQDYFDFVPKEPGITEIVDVVKKLTHSRLQDGGFRSKWESYIRQLLITGFSCMAITWDRKMENRKYRDSLGKVQTKYTKVLDKPKFTPIDSFDVFVDPLADGSCGNLFRIIRKTKAELMNSKYPLLDKSYVASLKVSSTLGPVSLASSHKRTTHNWMGIQYDPNEVVEVVEFWGDIDVPHPVTGIPVCFTDCTATFIGNHLCEFKPNPFWGGKPFIWGTCIPVPNKPYGLGVLEPVLGMLHQLNIITNQRLDNLELNIDTMWLVTPDGVLDLDEVSTAPGKVIRVGNPNSIVPVRKDNSFQVSYTEAQVLEQTIDQSVGTGAYIGTQQGRSGERVTATEIQAVRDAGGNRLSNIYGHIEDTQFLPCLRKTFYTIRQFLEVDEVIRVPNNGTYEYVQVGPTEIAHEFDVVTRGADHITQKEQDLNKLMNFVNMVSQVPPWAEMVNWSSLLEEVVKRFGMSPDVQSLIIKQQVEQTESTQPTDPYLETANTAQAIGGQPQVNNLELNAMTQGPDAAVMEQVQAFTGQAL